MEYVNVWFNPETKILSIKGSRIALRKLAELLTTTTDQQEAPFRSQGALSVGEYMIVVKVEDRKD